SGGQRDREGECLAGAGAAPTQDVTSSEGVGQRVGLDRERGGAVHPVEDGQQRGRNAEVGEGLGHALLWGRGRSFGTGDPAFRRARRVPRSFAAGGRHSRNEERKGATTRAGPAGPRPRTTVAVITRNAASRPDPARAQASSSPAAAALR